MTRPPARSKAPAPAATPPSALADGSVRAVDRALALLCAFQDDDGPLGLAEISRRVGLNMTKDALRALAAEALKKGTGARALRAMIERIMLDIMFESPGRDDIAEVTINRAVVEGKRSPLIRKKQEKDAA